MDYIYWSSPVAGQALAAFSPKTPTNRIYQYNETNDYFNGVNLSTEPSFIAGKGYVPSVQRMVLLIIMIRLMILEGNLIMDLKPLLFSVHKITV